MSNLHSAQTTNHIPHAFTFTTAAARIASTGFTAADVGKLARQSDNNSLWMLTATTPAWTFVGGGFLYGYARYELRLSWVDDDTIAVSPGYCVFPGGAALELPSAANYTFTALDTGSRTIGRDYAVFATTGGVKFVLIPTSSLGYPSGYTSSTARLLGYFHNGPKADGTVGASRNHAIFQYSITNNDLLNMAYPYRAHEDLAAGVPLPGMVKVGPLAVGIYQASREDATASAAGSSAYPTSRYGVVPWCSILGWATMAVARNVGCRLPTWEEWLGAVQFNPGSATPAVMNGNTNSGASSDDATQSGAADPTQAGRTLTGTGPRTANIGATAAGRSWYSPAGLADPVGNVWEWVAQFFGGLKTSSPGTAVAWGSNGDYAWNFQGQAYNPDTGGYTEGLPAMLIVGGSWGDGAGAGVRAANASHSPGVAYASLGCRLSR